MKVKCGKLEFDPDCSVSRLRHRKIHKNCKKAAKQRKGPKTGIPLKGKSRMTWIRQKVKARVQKFRNKKKTVTL